MNGEYWVGRESVSDLCNTSEVWGFLNCRVPQEEIGLTPENWRYLRRGGGLRQQRIAEHFKNQRGYGQTTFKQYLRQLGVSTRLELALFAVNQSLPFRPPSLSGTSEPLPKIFVSLNLLKIRKRTYIR